MQRGKKSELFIETQYRTTVTVRFTNADPFFRAGGGEIVISCSHTGRLNYTKFWKDRERSSTLPEFL